MPNIKSAIKRVKVSKTKNLRNRMVKSSVKTLLKKFDAAVAGGDAAQVESMLRIASGAVDKAASKGVIHKNAANRKKAQLARRAVARA
ncbi:MAG: 30S ribosomal protein S20 [Christensenellaceae bacterium]|nr:30S ribosomal protein S20 [Christensenellaceae bacterium]